MKTCVSCGKQNFDPPCEEGGHPAYEEDGPKCDNDIAPWGNGLPCKKTLGHTGQHEDVTGCHWG